jgi:hypothetical protein
MTAGRKMITDINPNDTMLITCSFKTTAYNKFKLVEQAKAQGLTISEILNNVVSFYQDNEDFREKFDDKFQRFLEIISDGNDKKMYDYIQTWKKI